LLILFFLNISHIFAQDLPFVLLDTDHKMASCVAFSPDGRLATASHDGKIYFWNVETQMTDNILDDHKEIVLALAFSPDGSLLATAGRDKQVLVWSVANGVVKYRLKDHTAAVTALSFSHDGKYLASGGADNKVVVWDMGTGAIHKNLDYHKKEISTLSFARTSYLLATGSYDGTVKIFDLESGEMFKQLNPNSGRVRSLAFSPDERLLATGTDDESIKVWDMVTGALKKTFKGHANDVYDLEFSPDGQYLASACIGNELRIWSLDMAENIHTLKGFYKLLSLSFSKDGKYMAVADLHTKTRVYDLGVLKIKPDPAWERLKSKKTSTGLLAAKPQIQIANPVTSKKEVIKTEAKSIEVKGRIQAESGLFMLLIDGVETPIDAQGNFSRDVKLGFLDNEIIVKGIDMDKRVTEDTIRVYRIFDKNNVNETAGMYRKGRDYALLIGTDEYAAMPKLSNPVNDINTVATELETHYSMKVEKVINPTLNEIYSAIRRYSKTVFANDDQLFIMIAGHGEYDEVFKEGYLVAKDSKKDDEGKQTYLSHSNLRTLLNNIPCQHILLVLDACFGGTFDQNVSSRGSENAYNGIGKEEFILRKLKYKTRLYLTSGGKEYVPDGRPGHHSPFTRKFLDALRSQGGEDKILTFSEVTSFTEKVIPEPRKGEFGDNQPGSDFLFIKKE
jgi:Tol biopolymer transport system component